MAWDGASFYTQPLSRGYEDGGMDAHCQTNKKEESPGSAASRRFIWLCVMVVLLLLLLLLLYLQYAKWDAIAVFPSMPRTSLRKASGFITHEMPTRTGEKNGTCVFPYNDKR